MFKHIGGIIVTYNPSKNLKDLLSMLVNLDQVIIVDNNSKNKEFIIQLVKKYSNVILLLNDSNEGLAKSYNKAEILFNSKIEWIFTFDQDSLPDKTMIFEIQNFLKIKNIGIIAPKVIDKNLIVNNHNNNQRYNYISSTIQSGMCINRKCMKEIEGFNEKLFMYYVDTDFCNKMNRKHKIIQVNSALIFHEDGKLEKKKFILELKLNERSETADYYRSRNLIYMIKTYGFSYSKDLLYDFIVKTLYSKNRKKYYKNTVKGLKDGMKTFWH
ncbi:MAG: glycosyltransferase [Fusobacteriaceae bacterium]